MIRGDKGWPDGCHRQQQAACWLLYNMCHAAVSRPLMRAQAEDTEELLARMDRHLHSFGTACRAEVSGVEETLGQVRDKSSVPARLSEIMSSQIQATVHR